MMPGMNPAMMRNIMRQMKMQPIEAERLIIERKSGPKLVINNPEITRMKVTGKEVLQVIGKLEELEEEGVPDDDVNMVAEQAGCSKDEARKALEERDGDIAEAILKLKK